jgi:predicted DNA-binding protein with PD1-like motif
MKLLRVNPGEEVLETLTRRAAEEGITNGAIVSLVGAVDECAISNMAATDAGTDIVSEYRQPLELTGTGEIRDGKVHVHVVLSREGDVALAGHLHRARVDTFFVHAYTLPIALQVLGQSGPGLARHRHRPASRRSATPSLAAGRVLTSGIAVPCEWAGGPAHVTAPGPCPRLLDRLDHEIRAGVSAEPACEVRLLDSPAVDHLTVPRPHADAVVTRVHAHDRVEIDSIRPESVPEHQLGAGQRDRRAQRVHVGERRQAAEQHHSDNLRGGIEPTDDDG